MDERHPNLEAHAQVFVDSNIEAWTTIDKALQERE